MNISSTSNPRVSRPVRIGRRVPRGLLVLAGLTALGVIVPLVYLVVRALEAEPRELLEIIWRWRNVELVFNTALLTFGVLLGSTLLALPMAWLLARSDLPLKRFWVVLAAIPLTVPGYVGAYALLAASGFGGTLEWLGVALPRPSGFWGALTILTLFTYPYLFLNLYSALRNVDPRLEEASRSLGHSRLHSFWYVTLPQLRPAWLAGALLIALHVLGDFGVVSLMRFETFSFAIYAQYTASLDRIYAAWLCLILLCLTISVLFLEGRLMRGANQGRSARGAIKPATPIKLGWWTAPSIAFIVGIALIAVALPIVTALHWTLRENTRQLYNPGLELLQATFGTLSVAAPTALICALLALPLAYLGVRYPNRWTALLERTNYLGYATPGLALALAIVYFSLRITPGLYQTYILLIAAYVLHFLAESIGPLRSSLLQTSQRFEEAARSLGAKPLEVLTRVLAPLISRGALAAMALVFLSATKELPITTILAPPGLQTLAKNVYTYTAEAQFDKAAPSALALILVSSAFIGLLLREKS